MIYYDPHKWLDHFFDIRGTLVREISGRVLICGVWTLVVVIFHNTVRPIGISSTLHSLVGIALGLLLVFRTNASYDRFWEGRKLWGGMVNECRNLVRSASLHLQDDPFLLFRLTRWTAIFPWAAASVLRGDSDMGPIIAELNPEDVEKLKASPHPALHAAQQMTQCVVHSHVSDIIKAALENNIQLLVDYIGGCERIRKTPLPFAYVVHLRRALVVYCFTLPFALVDSYGWFTIIDILLVAYTFFGIEEIGVEIEGPFGHDANDLPMQDICETIHNNVYALAGMGKPEREKLPTGL